MSTAEQAVRRAAAMQRGDPLFSLAGKPAEPYRVGRVLTGNATAFEERVSDATRQTTGEFAGLPTASGRGMQMIAIPPQAALETGTATGGQEFVFTRPGGFGPALRPMSIAARHGARIVTDAPDRLRLVHVTNAPAVDWVDGETLGAPADSHDLAFASETPTPSTGIATTSWSFRLDRQSTPEVERIVTDDFRAAVASIYDNALIAGSGVNGEPLGIVTRSQESNPDIASVDLASAAADWDDITEIERLLADADAPEPYGWIASPNLRTQLRRTFVTTGGDPIWRGASMLGHTSLASTNVPDGTLILGHWPDAVIVVHALHVIVDRVTRARQGLVVGTVYCVISIGLLRPTFVVLANAAHAGGS